MARIKPDEPVRAAGRTRIRADGLQRPAKPSTQAKAVGRLATKITREKASDVQHQGRHRQNSLPSGSARTYQFWSPWPDVDLSRAKGEQPIELGLLAAVEGFDVQVQPVLWQATVRPAQRGNRKSISNGLPSTPIDTP